MKSKQEILDEFFCDAEKNIKRYKPRTTKLDIIFVQHQERLLKMFDTYQASIKQVYNDLVEQEILIDIPYITFYQWVKRKQKEHNTLEHTTPNVENIIDKNIKLFHGFDIEKELDEVDNPLPDTLNVSSNFLVEELKKKSELNNHLIVLTVLHIIEKKKKNIFKESWSFLLIKDGEMMNEYTNRLQQLVDNNSILEDEILTYTTTLSRFTQAANSFQFQSTRRQQ